LVERPGQAIPVPAWILTAPLWNGLLCYLVRQRSSLIISRCFGIVRRSKRKNAVSACPAALPRFPAGEFREIPV
jgi:hypothetical protein